MHNCNEHKKNTELILQTKQNSNFTLTPDGENKLSINQIERIQKNNLQQSLFDQMDTNKLESLSKFLMMKFLTVIANNLYILIVID